MKPIMSMRSVVLSVFVCCFSMYVVHAQKNIDSLQQIFSAKQLSISEKLEFAVNSLKETTVEEDRVFLAENAILLAKSLEDKSILADTYTKLGSAEKEFDLEQAATYYQNALKVKREIGDSEEIARALYRLGSMLKHQGNHQEAIQQLKESASIFESNKSEKRLATVYNALGDTYCRKGEYAKSLTAYAESIKIREEIEDQLGLANSLLNLGEAYIQMENYPLALEYTEESLTKFQELSNDKGAAKACNNIGGIHYNQGHYILASTYYNRALNYDDIDESLRERIESNLQAILIASENYEEAASAYLEDLNLQLKRKDEKAIAVSNMNLGNIYYRTGAYEKASHYLKKALEAANTAHERKLELEIIRRLVDNYYYLKSPDSALMYLDHFAMAKDEIDENFTAALGFDAIKANHEKQDAERKEQNAFTRMLFAIMAGIIISFGAVFYAYRQRSKRLLAQKDHEQAVNQVIQNADQKIMNAKVEGMDTERTRISRDIHDSVGVILASTKLHFESLSKRLDNIESGNRERFDKAFSMLTKAQNETRRVIHDMANLTLAKHGLIAQVRELVESIKSANMIDVNLKVQGIDDRLDRKIEAKVYKILQELITNTLKYANASSLNIEIEHLQQELALKISDDGKGFDAQEVNKSSTSGLGLMSVRERVKDLGGEMHIQTAKGKGTTISIDKIYLN